MLQTPAAPNSQFVPPNTWVADLYAKLGWPLVFVSLFCGGIVYGIGFFLSIFSGFPGTYLKTFPVYYGLFGISWVMGCIRWGVLRLPGLLDEARICFKGEQQFVDVTSEFMGRLSNWRAAVWASAVVFFVGLAGLILGFVVFGQDIQSRLLPDLWYHGYLFGKTLILIIFDIGCSLPLGTGAWLIFTNTRFLHSLSRLQVIPLPGVLIARFRPLSAFYLVSALTWFLGVALFGLLFFEHLDTLSITILTVTGAFGLALSLGPQWVFYRFISQASSETAGEFARMFKADFAGRIDHGNLPEITSMLQATQFGQMWIINVKDLFLVMVGQLLPLVAVGLKEPLGAYVKHLLNR